MAENGAEPEALLGEKSLPVIRILAIIILLLIVSVMILRFVLWLKTPSNNTTKNSPCSSISQTAPPVKKAKLNICPGLEDTYVASKGEKTIRLYKCLSGVIGTEYGKHYTVTANGKFEKCLWDARKKVCFDATAENNHHYNEYGILDTNLFRLRSLEDSENYATVRVD